MAVIIERVKSRERRVGPNEELIRHYTVRNTADDAEVVTLVESTAPATVGSLVRQEIEIDPEFVDASNNKGIWNVRVRYVRPERAEPEAGDDAVVSFGTAGQTVNIKQARSHVGSWILGGISIGNPFDGAIGVTDDGVDGVDVVVPQYEFSETHYLSPATVTAAYRGTLFNLTGCQNEFAFRHLAAGECLFLGASGTRRGSGLWEINFSFAGAPNVTSLDIGSITIPAKRGWDYLWVRYHDSDEAGRWVKKPGSAHVERVYPIADFSLLGIGS